MKRIGTKRLSCEPLESRCLLSAYTVQQLTDAQGILEYQLFSDGYQFGTVEQTPQGGIGFRGHPDQSDPNGWGSTAWENVFIAGQGSGTIGGQVNSAVAGSSGIQISTGGNVPSAAGTVGTWTWNSLITYDASQQKVMLNGTTTVALTSALSGDMNIGSIASNYLYDYPLNGGGMGNTGDMKSVTFAYGPDSYIRKNQWTPVPGLTGTSPTDASYDVTLTDWGQINQSDPILATVSKPTVQRELVSTNPTTRMIVCCNWDSTAVGYWYDNIADEQIVRPQNTTATDFVFQNTSNWTLPDPTNPTVTANALTANTNRLMLTGTVNPSSPGKSITSVQIVVAGSATSMLLGGTITGTTWSAAVPTALAEGTYSIQATATDEAGNTAFAVAPLIVPLPGDANLDGQVDINDLTIVLTNYGQSGMTWSQGDFNTDTKVDINDLTIVLTDYGKTAGSGIKAVPEPSSVILLGVGAIALLGYGWRRRA
jgi:hypothetical protein